MSVGMYQRSWHFNDHNIDHRVKPPDGAIAQYRYSWWRGVVTIYIYDYKYIHGDHSAIYCSYYQRLHVNHI